MAQITRQEDRSFTITMRDRRSDGTVGDPVDLTGKTVTVVYRDEASVVQTIACTINNALLGKITVPFTDAQSASLRVGDFKFDIVITEGASQQIYPQENQITVRPRNS